MNDEDLDARLARLPESYEAEFDVGRGLERLRADGYGFRETSAEATDANIAATAVSGRATRSGSSVQTLGAETGTDSVRVNTSVALREGVSLGPGQVAINLAELEGGAYADPSLAPVLATGTRVAGTDNTPRELSAREVEVLQLVADGQSYKEIGEELSLSALTVKSHLSRIGRKLGTGDRAEMVALAMRAGVIL
ncbi:response regulator transcription factor [Amycolatopsis orientalis]|uniref:helix-turn-helix transcriptional regulator n=1 Tax=Amycolatopsis orientalis TaxID=31958 RepID=UPI003F699972